MAKLYKFGLLHGATALARGSAKWVVDIAKRDPRFIMRNGISLCGVNRYIPYVWRTYNTVVW